MTNGLIVYAKGSINHVNKNPKFCHYLPIRGIQFTELFLFLSTSTFPATSFLTNFSLALKITVVSSD